MNVNADVQARINRYLVDVSTYLGSRTPEERRELLSDLESHIHEALSRRGHEPTLADLEAVLAEMASPESYAAAPGGAAVMAAPGGPQSRLGLAKWALGIAIAGCILPLVLLMPPLFAVMQIIALALGIASWRHGLGKAAAITAGGLLVAGAIGFAIFCIFFIEWN